MHWGILGCGLISNDFVNALFSTPNATVVSCSARSEKSAKAFSVKHDIPHYASSYDDMLNDTRVEIVYIGTINTCHFQHTMRALAAGKHVVVEKPMAMSETEATTMIAFAKKQNLFLMEGMWTRFFPAVSHVHQLVRDGTIGTVQTVEADFGIVIPPTVTRLWDGALGGGAMLDLGVYTLGFITMIFGTTDEPTLTCRGEVVNGVDTHSRTVLTYPDGRIGTVTSSMIKDTSKEVTIVGTRGRITLHAWAHICETVTVVRINADLSETSETLSFPHPAHNATTPAYNFNGSSGFQYEATSVQDCITDGLLENPLYPLSESLAITKMLMAMRQQLGIPIPDRAEC